MSPSGTGTPTSQRTASARFGASPSELARLEDFVDSIPFLGADERNRVKIVASELLDNVISYSSSLRRGSVLVRVSGKKSPVLSFYFKSANFSTFAVHEKEAERRYFDGKMGRYRGLGLAMCRNLSRSMRFRPGIFVDSIVIRF